MTDDACLLHGIKDSLEEDGEAHEGDEQSHDGLLGATGVVVAWWRRDGRKAGARGSRLGGRVALDGRGHWLGKGSGLSRVCGRLGGRIALDGRGHWLGKGSGLSRVGGRLGGRIALDGRELPAWRACCSRRSRSLACRGHWLGKGSGLSRVGRWLGGRAALDSGRYWLGNGSSLDRVGRWLGWRAALTPISRWFGLGNSGVGVSGQAQRLCGRLGASTVSRVGLWLGDRGSDGLGDCGSDGLGGAVNRSYRGRCPVDSGTS
nr:hypothetical protein CFP56_46635 [Quercus suber]